MHTRFCVVIHIEGAAKEGNCKGTNSTETALKQHGNNMKSEQKWHNSRERRKKAVYNHNSYFVQFTDALVCESVNAAESPPLFPAKPER